MAKKYEIIVERDASRVTLDIGQVVPALPAIIAAPDAAQRAEAAAEIVETSAAAAQAWAEGDIPPDPTDELSRSAKTWAGSAADAATAAVTAQTNAEGAKDGAEAARDDAITAKEGALTAASDVQNALEQVTTVRKLSAPVGVFGEQGDPPFSIADGQGNIALFVDDEGKTSAAAMYARNADVDALSIGGAALAESVSDWAWAVSDDEGNVAAGIGPDGVMRVYALESTVPIISPPAPEPITHQVFFAFVEPYDDACTGALITWVSDSPAGKFIEYLADGGRGWASATSYRTRPFPNVADRWLHTAKVTGLTPDTVYNLRWVGAAFADTFITPRRTDVRVCVASDYQRTTYGASSQLALFGTRFRNEDVDLLILNGDYVGDDGVWNEENGGRWFGFMERLALSWRRDGRLVPIAAILGNHEARNAAGTSNAHVGGTGTAGPMVEVFSLGYDTEDVGYTNRSNWSFRVGREVAFVGYETDHTVPIPLQLPWIEAEFERLDPLVRHINLVGHAPAFHARNPNGWEQFATQAVTIKRDVWPIMERFADKCRAYWVGHEHCLTVTAPLRIDWDPSLTDAENGTRWITDHSGGVRQLGSGFMGGGAGGITVGEYDKLSTIDSSPKMVAALGYVDSAFEIYGAVETVGASDPYNMWIVDYSTTEFTAKAVDAGSHTFITITDTV